MVGLGTRQNPVDGRILSDRYLPTRRRIVFHRDRRNLICRHHFDPLIDDLEFAALDRLRAEAALQRVEAVLEHLVDRGSRDGNVGIDQIGNALDLRRLLMLLGDLLRQLREFTFERCIQPF